MNTRPDPDELAKRFEYNPDTGIIKRKVRSGRWPAGVAAGSKDGLGYYSTRINRITLRCHTIAWVLYYGKYPIICIDHINGNKTDNRIANLREAKHSQNLYNQKRKATNTSGTSGVSFHKPLSKWAAYITVDNKKIHLGVFSKKSDAVTARITAAKKYFGEFSPHDWNPQDNIND